MSIESSQSNPTPWYRKTKLAYGLYLGAFIGAVLAAGIGKSHWPPPWPNALVLTTMAIARPRYLTNSLLPDAGRTLIVTYNKPSAYSD